MKVVLLGYMASGKSTIGKLLASSLNYRFIDLDEEISLQMGMEIPSIFSKKGEVFFRKMETEVLGNILNTPSDFVLALGGGTPCYGNNMQLINDSTRYSFYLNLSIRNLMKRISKEKATRPLVADIPDDELTEFIGKHIFERVSFYSLAERTIFCGLKTEKDVVKEIKDYLI